jgi:LuxR family transcriptional regulator, maltose regulon positive regulatory protein
MDPSAEASPPIAIYTLGRFEVALEGVPLRFVFKVPRKPLALLKALLAGGKTGVSQNALCDTLWPDLEPWSAARALHITAFRLRGLLKSKTALIVQEGRVALDSEQCWVDAWQFEHSLGLAKDPTEVLWALRFYRGTFLADADHPLAIEARDRLSCKFIRSVAQLGSSFERIGDIQSAIDLYLMALDADGRCEELHQSLMRCLAREGQPSAVAAAYHRCRASLQRHFGTEPSAATEEIYREACPDTTTRRRHEPQIRVLNGHRTANDSPNS